MGGYGIVGGNLPLAAGMALASDYLGDDAVTVCMFGDGASNTGNFGETMNLAALWSLPVVFILENNLYGMGTAVERHSAVTDFSKKAEGLGVPGVRADGMDVVAMRETVAEHLRIAREERRPTLVEAFTYRYRGHSAADPEVYREKEEVEEWRKKDPIEVFAARLEAEGDADRGRARARSRARRGAGARRGRVRRRFARAAARHALRPPLRGRRPGAGLVRGRRAGARSRSRASASASSSRARRSGSPRRAPPTAAGPPRPTGREAGVQLEDRDGGDALEEIREEFISEEDEGEHGGTLVDGGPADARGASRRDGRGDAPRRDRLRDGRGRRRLPGRVQGHRGAARRVRREAGPRHPDLREHDRRDGGRLGDGAGCGRSSS